MFIASSSSRRTKRGDNVQRWVNAINDGIDLAEPNAARQRIERAQALATPSWRAELATAHAAFDENHSSRRAAYESALTSAETLEDAMDGYCWAAWFSHLAGDDDYVLQLADRAVPFFEARAATDLDDALEWEAETMERSLPPRSAKRKEWQERKNKLAVRNGLSWGDESLRELIDAMARSPGRSTEFDEALSLLRQVRQLEGQERIATVNRAVTALRANEQLWLGIGDDVLDVARTTIVDAALDTENDDWSSDDDVDDVHVAQSAAICEQTQQWRRWYDTTDSDDRFRTKRLERYIALELYWSDRYAEGFGDVIKDALNFLRSDDADTQSRLLLTTALQRAHAHVSATLRAALGPRSLQRWNKLAQAEDKAADATKSVGNEGGELKADTAPDDDLDFDIDVAASREKTHSDEELMAWIASYIQNGGTACSSAVQALRESGMPCAEVRFRRLWKATKSRLSAGGAAQHMEDQ